MLKQWDPFWVRILRNSIFGPISRSPFIGTTKYSSGSSGDLGLDFFGDLRNSQCMLNILGRAKRPLGKLFRVPASLQGKTLGKTSSVITILGTDILANYNTIYSYFCTDMEQILAAEYGTRCKVCPLPGRCLNSLKRQLLLFE